MWSALRCNNITLCNASEPIFPKAAPAAAVIADKAGWGRMGVGGGTIVTGRVGRVAANKLDAWKPLVRFFSGAGANVSGLTDRP